MQQQQFKSFHHQQNSGLMSGYGSQLGGMGQYSYSGSPYSGHSMSSFTNGGGNNYSGHPSMAGGGRLPPGYRLAGCPVEGKDDEKTQEQKQTVAAIEKNIFYPCPNPSVFARMMYNLNSQIPDEISKF
jgi:hypothetical protein